MTQECKAFSYLSRNNLRARIVPTGRIKLSRLDSAAITSNTHKLRIYLAQSAVRRRISGACPSVVFLQVLNLFYAQLWHTDQGNFSHRPVVR